MGYRPIESYGVVGDLRTVALVGTDGSIDWFCFPRFDSPSVFAAILDDEKGGHFKIAPKADDLVHRQLYWPETNVLITRFLCPDGVAEVIDWMPVEFAAGATGQRRLVRHVRVTRGALSLALECFPAFDYARAMPEVELTGDGALFRGPGLSLGLTTAVPLERHPRGATARFTLHEGESAAFVLHEALPGRGCGVPMSALEADDEFQATVGYWRHWLGRCTYVGRWRETVHRSALVLKLLSCEPTGAIVAAPTCGLPEAIGGERNWDYRYTWVRDAAFTLYGLLRIGLTEEAAAFMGWLDDRCHEPTDAGPLQLMYGLDGRQELPELTLDHLDGYRGSRPVRIGNGAAGQLQLDIYGDLLDAVYLYNKHGAPISAELWSHLRAMLDWLEENWQRPDDGVWEVRSGRQQVVFSKLMSWVAFDRGLRLADKRSFPAPRDRWLRTRDRIYEEIMTKGWNDEVGAFVGHYGGSSLDASALLMPLVFFLAPTDPRMLATLDAIQRPVKEGGLVADGLVYRYDPAQIPDGLGGREGTFNLCTFWLVEALTRAGRLDEARLAFERMLGHANHLGLYAEEIGPSGEALGNFPQAFTHLALISAAFNLDRALDARR
ncbi:MAG: glycoside hydrolase family 15 protein [Chloroflexota bacterium]|nr:glycoside hydrolase family 15 protein [Chloroflexota bacterium]